ncbi:uncharacterized protein LOC128963613 [Oppia nitens]|uniref:uncharacterized protein LOC128963613 n=1 Tax=Oppia nitens TaxID=1686743 RepID=UPI0023DA1F55|nr:uncharacterized protein LOC128963613 [Oppia nitens]
MDLRVERGDSRLNTSWSALLVSTQLEYIQIGDRYHYQGFLNERRKKLMDLVLAEMVTQSGKYIKEIANGVWLLLEESSWIWPAHLYLQKAGLGLPDPQQIVIDLGAGQTSAYIAWTQLLIGQKLSQISPIISKRIDYELNRRIVRPFLDDPHMPWMGFDSYRFVDSNVGNNWNVWINSNILMTALLCLPNTYRIQVIDRLVNSSDIFVNRYPNDGSDNEGPHYWVAAGGRLIQIISLLSSASKNTINWSSNKLLKQTGDYIWKVHINENHFFNYGDSGANEIPDSSVVFEYGKVFNDQTMKEFASYLTQLSGKDKIILDRLSSGELNQIGIQMSANVLLENIPPKAPLPLESWFPDLQLVTLRTTQESAKGIFLGIKAGINDDTQHNHNDVGSFILYVDGRPALIDVGSGTYTIKTFSPERYSIWNFQSQWHNIPTINGIQQGCGPKFMANSVKYSHEANISIFEADISGAYPYEAQVDKWNRKWTFNRTTNVVKLTETYKLTQFIKFSKIHFITHLSINKITNETIILGDNKTKLYIDFSENQVNVEMDCHLNDDPTIEQSNSYCITK